MPVIEIDSLDDPRVWAYRDLKDRELAKAGRRFIAEGHHVALRLLGSDYACESVLCSDKRLDMVQPHVPAGVDLFVAPAKVVDAIVGYQFHSGVLAVGLRPPVRSLDAWMASVRGDSEGNPLPGPLPKGEGAGNALTLVVCPHTRNCDNLGSIIRIAAAMGADGLLLGEACTDPFWRRTIRVSMGTVFRLPLRVSEDLAADLRELRARYGVTLVATTLDDNATPLQLTTRPPRLGLLLGSEDQGLGPHWTNLCDQKVTLAMHHGTDSLNVATAAAVFLYHYGAAHR